MSTDRLFGLEGEVAIVTGAGRGIGEGIAYVLAEAGASVVVAARRAAEIERVAKEIVVRGGQAIAVPTDVTDRAAVERLAAETKDTFGKIDVWVNNAGGSAVQSKLVELDRADWDASLELNLTSVWLAAVVASKEMADGGRIVNISSRAAQVPIPGSGHYAAAKAGVNNLTRTLAIELGPRIRVNAIEPGAVPTEIMMTALGLEDKDLPALEKNLRLPMRRLGTPEDLGAAVLYLSSPASSWVTGQILVVSGGF